MGTLALGIGSALWLGLLTSISPCPLATNVAAMSFIGRRVGNARLVVLTGLVYTLGRVVAYVGLGTLLVVIGMVLLELLTVPTGNLPFADGLRKRAESWGLLGAGLLGFIFALSFCPVSAALFFGSLVPLAVRSGSRVALPSVYGIGTGLPVFFFAVLIALGAQWVGRAFNAMTKFEKWARRVTGVLFIGLGIYESLRSIFGVL